MSKCTWLVTVAGKQSMMRCTLRSARAQVELMVEHQMQEGLIPPAGDIAQRVARYRADRVWKKEGTSHTLLLDSEVLAALDPT